MRYDTPIYFQTITTGPYDPKTGNHGDDSIVETKVYANVSSTGIETLNLIYGELKQGILILRLQQAYDKPFDRIRIGKKTYRVDFTRNLRVKSAFIVSEVQ